MELLIVGLLIILVPLAMAVFGIALLAGAVETIRQALKDNK